MPRENVRAWTSPAPGSACHCNACLLLRQWRLRWLSSPLDGSLWFSTWKGYAIGRINPKGVATAYNLTDSIPFGTVDNPNPKSTALSQNGDVDVLETLSIGFPLKSMVSIKTLFNKVFRKNHRN
jgi:hypothetical protein